MATQLMILVIKIENKICMLVSSTPFCLSWSRYIGNKQAFICLHNGSEYIYVIKSPYNKNISKFDSMMSRKKAVAIEGHKYDKLYIMIMVEYHSY